MKFVIVRQANTWALIHAVFGPYTTRVEADDVCKHLDQADTQADYVHTVQLVTPLILHTHAERT